MPKIGTDAYVLAYLPNSEGPQWCPVKIIGERPYLYILEFLDGCGTSIFPRDEVFDQPDLKMCSKVQS